MSAKWVCPKCKCHCERCELNCPKCMTPRPESQSEKDVVEVKAILVDGDLFAAPAGTMHAIFAVINDPITGDIDLEFKGMATLTGAHNMLRWFKS